jgi:putative phage-type endonuclease
MTVVGELVTPTGVFLGKWEIGSPEWHAARRQRLGGSEIAAVLGLSPWESRFSLWHRKRGEIADQPENPEMEWGKRLEPVLLAKYLDEHPGHYVGACGTFVHHERTWQLANPDALVHDVAGEPLLWEGKVSRDDIGWGDPGTEQVPVYYLCQVRHYLDVLGLDRAVLSVLIAGQDYREYEIHADESDAATLRQAGAEFIASITRDERPDIDAHSATYTAVRELHPDIEPVDVEIPAPLAKEFCESRVALSQAESRVQLAKSQVADLLGTGRRARFNGSTLATRQAKGEGLPYLVAGRNLPDFSDTPTSPQDPS